jgi:hypothetical protein
MPVDFANENQWERIRSELETCRANHVRNWGAIDIAVLGRFLAGEASAEESAQVEKALQELPDLRKLTEVARDVFEAPLLSFEQAKRKRVAGNQGLLPAVGRRGALVAAACLLLAIGVTMAQPGFLRFAGNSDSPRKQAAALSSHNAENLAIEAKEGSDVDRAEPRLRQVHEMCQNNLGANHPATVSAARNLAEVYQVALNSPAPANKRTFKHLSEMANTAALSLDGKARSKDLPVAAPAPPNPAVAMTKNRQALRARLVCQSTGQVEQTVVPVLTSALSNPNASAAEKVGFLRALGELGPAARNSLPVITKCFKNGKTEIERHEALLALAQMGPAAKPAVPGLVEDLKSASPADAATLKKVVSRLQGPEGRVGIADYGNCFTLKALQENTESVRTLASSNKIEVFFETVILAPTAADRARLRKALASMGPRAVVLLASRDGLKFFVEASPALIKAGFSTKKMADMVTKRFKAKEHDQGLFDVVDFLMDFQETN